MAALKPIRNRPGSSGLEENVAALPGSSAPKQLWTRELSRSSGQCAQLGSSKNSCDRWLLIKTALIAPGSRSRSFAALLGRLVYKSSDYTQFWQLWNMAHLHAIFNFVLPNEKQIWQFLCQILYTFYQMNKRINKCGPGFWQNLQLRAGYTQFLVAETATSSINFLFYSFKIWQLCFSLF